MPGGEIYILIHSVTVGLIYPLQLSEVLVDVVALRIRAATFGESSGPSAHDVRVRLADGKIFLSSLCH